MTGSWLRTLGARSQWALAVGGVTRLASATVEDAPPATERSATSSAVVEVLVVERNAGAQTCPSALELLRSVETVRGRKAPASIRYEVHFSYAESEFRAHIEDLSAHSVRALDDDGRDCSGLARATVITLALLFDGELRAESEAQPQGAQGHDAAALGARGAKHQDPPPPEVSHEPVVVTRAAREPQLEASKPVSETLAVWSSGLHFGASAVGGVSAPTAFGPALALDVATRRLRGELGVFWSPSRERDFGAGTISTSLLVGDLRACITPARFGGTRFELCSGAMLGRVTGQARGYASDGLSHRPWAAIPVLLVFASDVHALGWQAGLGGLVPIQREDFRVAGLGPSYRSWPVAATLFVRLSARHWY